MKQDINWYMNRAKNLNDITSDRKLALRLNMVNIARWRNPDRPDVPSMEAMIKLAKLAKVPAETALVHRDIWEAEIKTPAAVPIFKKILKSLPQYAAALLVAFFVSVAPVDFDGGSSAYDGAKSGAQVQKEFILWNIL